MVAPALIGLAGPLMNLIDDLFTSDEERTEARNKLIAMEQSGRLQEALAQVQVNLQEAKSESLFVSGWRPAVGWTCCGAFAYAFVIQPFASFIALALGADLNLMNHLPDLDLDMMMPVLLGMLGLGGMRTFEKHRGANKRR